ncbi:MAG: hypothetical protein J6S90_01515, partial [Lentisphaeria bacterium]|nr:hypothetical protein [Lentisphaeria bacterium]
VLHPEQELTSTMAKIKIMGFIWHCSVFVKSFTNRLETLFCYTFEYSTSAMLSIYAKRLFASVDASVRQYRILQ